MTPHSYFEAVSSQPQIAKDPFSDGELSVNNETNTKEIL